MGEWYKGRGVSGRGKLQKKEVSGEVIMGEERAVKGRKRERWCVKKGGERRWRKGRRVEERAEEEEKEEERGCAVPSLKFFHTAELLSQINMKF